MLSLSNKYTLLSLILLLHLPSKAQETLFEVQEINVKDGLPHRIVSDIVQDKDGFIWISTVGAISRYDGKYFESYDAEYLGVSENATINLAVDKENNIWFTEKTDTEKIGKGGVLNTKENKVFSFERYTNGLFDSSEVLSINKSTVNQEEWLVITRKGIIYKYNGTFEPIFKFPNEIQVTAFCKQSQDGDYWIAHHGTVFRVRNQEVIQSFNTGADIYSFKGLLPNPIFENIRFDLEYLEYLELKDSTVYPYSLPNYQPTQISSIIHIGKKFTLFTTDLYQNLVIQDKKGKVVFKYNRQENKGILSKIMYRNVFIDKQGIIWISTGNGILKIVQRENAFSISQENNSVRGIYIEGTNKWIGGYKNSIFPNTKKIGDRWELVNTIPMTHFAKDEKNHLWIGTTSAKLVAYNPSQNEQTLYNLKDRLHFYYPFYNNSLNQLWIGTNNGLVHFDRTHKIIKPIQLSTPSTNMEIRQIYENEEGVWLVTSKGLFLLSKNTATILQHYDLANKLPHSNLNYLYEDKAGIFWLASKGGGLIKWDRKKNAIIQFRQEDGLSNNVLYAVYEDDYQHLWLPSNYGLMAFDKITNNTKVYLPENGVAHEEFNTFSHFQASDGTLYFGGVNGITKFHPKNFYNNKIDETPLHITKINVLAQNEENFVEQTTAYRNTKQIELNPDYQILEVELSLLDFESTNDNQYAYQIEGYQDQWIYSNDNKISFINIPYGNYTINFKARGASGIWTTKFLQIPIQIKTPFYLQSWFFFIMTFFGLVGLYVLIKWREIQFEKDRERLEVEVKRRTLEIEKGKEIILKQAEELKQLDKAKTRFFSNITHEFRTPLTLIIGPLQQMIKNPNIVETKQRLGGILKNAQQILKLINQLLDIAKLEGGKMQVEVSRGNIVEYTQQLVNVFLPTTQEKNQRLVFASRQSQWEVLFDKDKWDKIVYNLLFNAIKFTPKGGLIKMSLSKMQQHGTEWISLRVSDTGIGIPEKKLPNIFNRFYQTNASSTREHEGTGIGLALVKELIELQGGEIRVTSKLNKGTTFEIQIPVLRDSAMETTSKASPLEAPILATTSHLPEAPIKPTRPNRRSESNKLSLLLIEDNREMQQYISSCINMEKYEVITANDGREGMEKALAFVPDLIVSDVMMPFKNGFEVTQEVRSNVATSHIPIILLTAKAALESRLEGLSRGADAYLTKPFSPEELSIRIQKLIEIRQVLQQRYKSHQVGLSNPLLEKFEKEDNFVEELKAFIQKNLDNPSLNGDIIGAHFRISRMQLHRKLKALTNQSISQFIQNIRFALALDLLQMGTLNISEIAYQIGFSNPSSFSKAFKQKYGKSPSSMLRPA